MLSVFLGSAFSHQSRQETLFFLGLRLGVERFFQVLVSLAAITGYIGGVALGARIVDPTPVPKKIWPTTVTKAFAIEILVLLLLAIVGFYAGGQPSGPILYTLIALATIPMGIQGAAVRALGVSDVSTTYITGTWTGLISGLVGRRSSTTIPGEKKLETRIQAAVVIVYVLAAVAGGVAVTDWSVKATIIPVISIGLVIAVARIRIR